MAPQIGTLAKSPEDLRVIPGTHVAEGKNSLLRVISDSAGVCLLLPAPQSQYF